MENKKNLAGDVLKELIEVLKLDIHRDIREETFTLGGSLGTLSCCK